MDEPMKSSQDSADGKVHFLKSAQLDRPSADRGVEELYEKMAGRLDRLEKEFNRHALRLEKELKNPAAGDPQAAETLRTELKELRGHLDRQVHDILSTLKVPSVPSPAGKEEKTKKSFWESLKEWSPGRLLLPKPTEALLEQEVDPFGRDPDFEQKVKPVFDFLYYRYWRVTTHGLENIPSRGRSLLVANHSGTLPYDGSMIRLAVTNDHPSGRDVRFLVEDFVYYLPFVGSFMYRTGGVRASQENAERLLNKDHLVAVFPEGVKGIGKYYKERYHLQRFGRGGFIKLALRTGSPVIPVAVIGAEEIHPILYKSSLLAKPFGIPYIPFTPTLPLLGPLGLIPFPTKWSIYFGKPIDLSKYGKKTLEDELAVHRLSEMVRQTIQKMITEALKQRKSVWRG
jgi:1-acyl-sn-glycerol-3-phosphate acyltransferase